MKANYNIENKKLNKGTRSFLCDIFLDTGKGFNASEVAVVPLYEYKYHFKTTLAVTPDIKGIRFDPVEGQYCILNDLQIITDSGLIDYTYTNGTKINNLLFFDTTDPQIAIEFGTKEISMVEISGEIYMVSFGDIILLSKRLHNSKSWHSTKLLLKSRSFIRNNKVLYLVAKGLLSVKRNGIIETVRKVKRYGQRQLKKLLNSTKFYSLSHQCEYQKNMDFSGYMPKVKTIAFYLPQFHSIPENDEWWGKDFTEWTNTRKVRPRFRGHYQPREPHEDFGYYNLTDIEVLKKQAKLAKQHGIYGFCFYLYWFSGKRLLEKPLDIFLKYPEININFCLCWANENWTRRWDGQDKEILIKQGYSDDDPINFINDIKKYIVDERYIRIDDMPVIIVYNPGHIPNIKDVFIKWRKQANEIGIGKIKILTCNACGHTAESLCIEDHVDGMIEFPPHHLPSNLTTNNIYFEGKKDGIIAHIYNYKELVAEIKKESVIKNKISKPVYRTCILDWDNAARKKDDWYTFAGYSLRSFYEWISLLVSEASHTQNPVIFLNAWNEWGEGTYLEPDKKYGYANINTLSKAICGLPFDGKNYVEQKKLKKLNNEFINTDKIKICVHIHLYYMDLLDEIINNLNFIPFPFHCYISTDTDEKVTIIQKEFTMMCKNAHAVYVKRFENRGRDVAPFICQMRNVINKYDYILHIHTKRSLASDDYGDDWREYLYNNLLGSTENIYRVFNDFIDRKELGLIFPKTYSAVIPHMLWGTDIQQGKKNVLDFLERTGAVTALGDKPEFPSGNMFWARTNAIKKAFSSGLTQDDFPVENNQKDMTLAHAIERSWVYIAQNEGYTSMQMSYINLIDYKAYTFHDKNKGVCMHKEIFKRFHYLDDSKWSDLIYQSVDSQVINGVKFPGFPDDNIQIGMIGSSGKNALYEPKYMYQEIRRIAARQKLIFNKKTTLLDFACGYGRNIRFFMKDIYPGNLYGSDVRTDFIDICRNTFCTESYNVRRLMGEVLFDINTPFPPLKYKEETFDIIMAYSLFSHLSEDAHLTWLKEFSRVLKKGGLLFLTIRQNSFLTNLRNISISSESISNYHKMLIEKLMTASNQERFSHGEYIYTPSGGGAELTSNFYGDTVIPDKYILTKWVEWFDIIEHYDDPSRLPQAFICLRPKK